MHLIFPAEPMKPNQIDPTYEEEALVCDDLGIAYGLINFEALVYEGNASKAVSRVGKYDAPTLAVYRGWMLRPKHYALLYAALAARGVVLINDPGAYRHCHYLPEWYPELAEWTPRSVWLPVDDDFSIDRVMEILTPFGDAPVIVKDYVKSRKHEWDASCFIPSAADRAAVERVVTSFLAGQGRELNEGLVFREYIEFASSGEHEQGGMPLIAEHRIFFLDGAPLELAELWDDFNYITPTPERDHFVQLATKVPSRFFTMDVARKKDGEWIIVELGDAQVAGLAAVVHKDRFYGDLCARLSNQLPL